MNLPNNYHRFVELLSLGKNPIELGLARNGLERNGNRRVIELLQRPFVPKNRKIPLKSGDLARTGNGRERQSSAERQRIQESDGEFAGRIRRGCCCCGSQGSEWWVDSKRLGHIVDVGCVWIQMKRL